MRKFTLGLEAGKNSDYTEKCLKQKLHGAKFPKKTPVDAYLYLPQEWSQEALKIWRSGLIRRSIWKRTDTILLFHSYFFSATISVNFYRPDKIYGMIFESMYIFRSQLPYRITQCLQIDVKVFLSFLCIIFQKRKYLNLPSSILGVNRDMSPLSFLRKFYFANFCLKHFSI